MREGFMLLTVKDNQQFWHLLLHNSAEPSVYVFIYLFLAGRSPPVVELRRLSGRTGQQEGLWKAEGLQDRAEQT